ncbi:MAG: msrA [Candidatus Peribacteria bacterium]|nr:msrA [Candidatus Peribacteria bacterium]
MKLIQRHITTNRLENDGNILPGARRQSGRNTANSREIRRRLCYTYTMSSTQLATFGAGCFWGVEETFRQLPGVLETAVGYTGGTLENPTYEAVCNNSTGHAEAVQITYDPAQVTYEQLLDVFWNNHNPTTPNQQGPDFGTQYRSAIFFHTPAQEEAAKKSKETLDASGKWKKPVVTDIVPAEKFWEAEEYHQKYLLKRGLDACHI